MRLGPHGFELHNEGCFRVCHEADHARCLKTVDEEIKTSPISLKFHSRSNSTQLMHGDASAKPFNHALL
jgi:hypothetical protein